MLPYQKILESESTKNVINHRNFLRAKILCVPRDKKHYYKDMLDNVDYALQQVFDAYYQSEDNSIRIDHLLAFWQQIDQ